ncbi:MAG: serine/threonine-protein kinase [Acidobacteriota bacterium]|nr:serine/threonine-protein kinase [Acidobacteriota bacterium]
MQGQFSERYEMVEKLGAGGMGVVHLVRDKRLNRLAAIKVLLPEDSGDSVRHQRFLREAQAASALNHPNIVTVYDVSAESEHPAFLVMEYVKGRTLGQVINRKGMSVPDVLRYAVPITGALAAAHEAGIVHRDLKPANVMIGENGLVKVLDFGLAKLQEPEAAEVDSATRTIALPSAPITESGTVVGTTAYMSPEQAEGKPVDARSDIFSLGSLLYEMCSGQRAFRGDSPMSTLAAVIAREPVPLHEIAPAVPVELERVIARCLRKDPARRFQSMRDLQVTLEDIRSDSDSGHLSGQRPAVPPTRRTRAVLMLIVLGLALAAAGAWAWRSFLAPRSGQPLALERLTFDSGLTTDPAISPDGKLIAYASDRAGQGSLDIWVQYLGGEPVRVTHNPADEFQPSFSPDGTQIVYRSNQDPPGIYLVSSLGAGEPRLVAQGGDWPRFSPNGKEILFANPQPASMTAYTASVTSAHSQRTPVAPDFGVVLSPVWSPDGKDILFIGVRGGPNPEEGLWVIPRGGGQPSKVEFDPSMRQSAANPKLQAWLRGDRLIVENEVQGRPQMFSAQLSRNPWRLTRAEQLTSGTGSAAHASVGMDGTMVLSNEEGNLDLWSLPVDANPGRPTGEPHRLTQDAADQAYPSISVDGTKLVYSSDQANKSQIWRTDLPGGATRRLTASPDYDARPVISADGTVIAYKSQSATGQARISVISADGAPLRQVDDTMGIVWDWFPDKRRFLVIGPKHPFSADVVTLDPLSRAPFVQRRHDVSQCHISHDGRWAVIQDGGLGVLLAPVLNGKPAAPDGWRQIGWTGVDLIRWSPDDKTLYFISNRDSFRCVWAQRLDPTSKAAAGEPLAFAHFHQARRSLAMNDSGMIGLAVATDKIVLAEMERTGNIWKTNLGR